MPGRKQKKPVAVVVDDGKPKTNVRSAWLSDEQKHALAEWERLGNLSGDWPGWSERSDQPDTPNRLVGRDAYIARLRTGETVQFRESGNSMSPRIRHRQLCTYAPIVKAADVHVGDAVFCKVGSYYYTHLVKAIRGDQFQLSNLKGRVNGWTTLDNLFGKVISVEN